MMASGPFTLKMPDVRTTSVVFASPHSGRAYAKAFLRRSILDQKAIRSSEDAFVDRLFERAPQFGAPILMADTPRAYVDLNRSPDELDPALIAGVRQRHLNPRISSGLGVIPRVVANGRAIYRGKLTLDTARQRIAEHWRPYHDTLQMLLDDSHILFGEAILIDLHSMPQEALDAVTRSEGRRPDIVLGDRFGAASNPEIMDRIEAAFAAAGLNVARNTPFAGAYITQRYGRPSKRQFAVQVEINRSLYMDEVTISTRPDFRAFRSLMSDVMAEITEIGRNALPVAAE